MIWNEPTIEKAAANVSKLLFLEKDLVAKVITNRLADRENVEKFFVLRSLIGQINLSNCTFSNLEEEKRINLLIAYIDKHFALNIGDYFPGYGAIQSKFMPSFYRTLKTNSFSRYIKDIKETTDCLFPKKDLTLFTSEDLVWSLVSSKWLSGSWKRLGLKAVPNQLATVYDLNEDSRAYQAFILNCSSESLYEAVKLTPMSVRQGIKNPTWGTYKDVPVAMPPACVSPLGFDFMAYQMYGYVDGMDFTRIWSM